MSVRYADDVLHPDSGRSVPAPGPTAPPAPPSGGGLPFDPRALAVGVWRRRALPVALTLLAVPVGILVAVVAGRKVFRADTVLLFTPLTEGDGASTSLQTHVSLVKVRRHLDETSRRVLEDNAKVLGLNPGFNIVIEGHCDERGTIESLRGLESVGVARAVDPHTARLIRRLHGGVRSGQEHADRPAPRARRARGGPGAHRRSPAARGARRLAAPYRLRPAVHLLLDDTVRRNVALGVHDGVIDDAHVWTVLRQARLEEVGRDILLKSLRECRSTYEIAERLGINQSSVVRKIKKYGLRASGSA